MPEKKSTILIVDDMIENIDILYFILKDEYEIKVATSGKKALELVNTNSPPDLILMDVIMPRMDGFEVCRKLKSSFSTKNIPIIFVTSKEEEIDEKKGFELGAVDYISKPVQPFILLERVKTHLSLHNQKKHLVLLVKEQTEEILTTRLKIIHRLAKAGEYKDNQTGKHVIRMSKYCHLIGESIGMSKDEADLLLNVASLHDIGKIGIPDKILLKPGKLDADEWIIMKSHTQIGAEIIGEDNSDILREARICALTHHEKWDGSGYPKGLKGENIPLYGRIAALADVFDALTSDRPYKNAWSVQDALKLIRTSKNSHFDPYLTDIFIDVFSQIIEIKNQYKD